MLEPICFHVHSPRGKAVTAQEDPSCQNLCIYLFLVFFKEFTFMGTGVLLAYMCTYVSHKDQKTVLGQELQTDVSCHVRAYRQQ